MKILYRIFIILTIILLSLGLYLGHLIKPNNDEHIGTNTDMESTVEEPKELQRVNAFDGDKPLHILILGVDNTKTKDGSDGDVGRSDTLMLLTANPKNKKAQLLSIPRDTYVSVPGHGKTKINHAYARGGYKLTKKTVENFLDVDIDYYAIVDYDAVKELTNTVGGVEVYMPVDYKYSDTNVIPPLRIDFKAGYHLVKGDDAIGFLRIRKVFEDQDIGRIGQQQQFLMSLFQKMKRPGMIFKLPQLVDIVQKYVKTDLSYGQIADLAYFALSMDTSDIEAEHLEGGGYRPDKDGPDYWVVNQSEARKKVKNFAEDSDGVVESSNDNLVNE